MNMQIKIHKSYRDLVAVCDTNLVGKYFEEGNFQIDVKESFYKGEEIDEEELIEILQDMKKEDATFNIVGEKSVNASLKAGIISKDNVKKISKIPYSLVLL